MGPFSVKSRRHVTRRHQEDSGPSISSQTPELRQISAWFTEVSDSKGSACGDGRCALADVPTGVGAWSGGGVEQAREEASGRELGVAREQLWLTQDDVVNLRQDLDEENVARLEGYTVVRHNRI